MKKQILAYITAVINQYSRGTGNGSSCYTNVVINDLTDLESFVADLKDEPIVTDESIYVKRIVELQEENEELKMKFSKTVKTYNETCFGLEEELKRIKGPQWVQD